MVKKQRPPVKGKKYSKEQISKVKKNRRRERYYSNKLMKRFWRAVLARFALFMIVIAIMVLLIIGAIALSLSLYGSGNTSSYKFTIEDIKYTVPYKDAVRDGHVYVSFTDIADVCDLSVTGTPEDMKLVIIGDEAETIRFVTGTATVYVNTVETRMCAESYYENDKLYVPLEFVESYLLGLKVKKSDDGHTVKITRNITNLVNGYVPAGEEPEYERIRFSMQLPTMLEAIPEDDWKDIATMPDMGFMLDLSEYEQYMNCGASPTYLRIAGKQHKMEEADTPDDLDGISYTREGYAIVNMRLSAARSLDAMLKEMEAEMDVLYPDIMVNDTYDEEGNLIYYDLQKQWVPVSVTDGFHSHAYQTQLFNNALQQCEAYGDDAWAEAEKLEFPAGCSEYQTGLLCDMDNSYGEHSNAFATTLEYKWLSENSWKFGFTVRYPEGKQGYTGNSFKPWVFRFVGRYHASQMKEKNMCLEEYREYVGVID